MLLGFITSFFAAIGIDDAIILGIIATAAGSATSGISSWLGNTNAKKQLSRDAKKNYRYSLLMAQNGPSATVQGLRAANLNPILAATDGSFSTPTMPSVKSDMSNNGGASLSSGLSTAIDLKNAFVNEQNADTQARQVTSNVELQRSQSFKNFVSAMNEFKTGGFKTDTLSDLHNIGMSLGFKSDEVDGILKAFGYTKPTDGKSAPNGSVTPPHIIKQRHHPADDSFKSNWSDDTAAGKFFNDIDRRIHRDRYDRKVLRDTSKSIEAKARYNELPRSRHKHYSFLYR